MYVEINQLIPSHEMPRNPPSFLQQTLKFGNPSGGQLSMFSRNVSETELALLSHQAGILIADNLAPNWDDNSEEMSSLHSDAGVHLWQRSRPSRRALPAPQGPAPK